MPLSQHFFYKPETTQQAMFVYYHNQQVTDKLISPRSNSLGERIKSGDTGVNSRLGGGLQVNQCIHKSDSCLKLGD